MDGADVSLSPASTLGPKSIPAEKWARLEAFLGSLSSSAAARLMTALEHDRAHGLTSRASDGARSSAALPHAPLLTVLRTLLRDRGAAFPPRARTAQRVFFEPFEDFFAPARRGRKRQGRIPRSSLDPIWTLLMEDAACAEAAEAAHALDALSARGRDGASAEREAAEARLFAAAADGLARLVVHAETDAPFRSDLARRLGGGAEGAAALHDLAEFDFLSPLVDRLKALQKRFPKPFTGLDTEELYEARKLYAAAQRDDPERAGYLLLAFAGRLGAPWRASRLYYHLRDADVTNTVVERDAAVIFETTFADLEGLARALERDAEAAFDGADAAARLDYAAEYAGGMIEEARRGEDGAAVNRVEASRDVIASAAARFAEQALMALRAATPTRHAGGSSRLVGLRPDFDRRIPSDTADAARMAARYLASAPQLMQRLARFGDRRAGLDEIVADAAAEARRYAGDLIAEIRAAEGEERARARRMMDLTLDIAAPLIPNDDIGLLKDKAAAAAVSA